MTGKFKFIMINLNQEMQMIIFIGPREEITQNFFIGVESYKGSNQCKKNPTFVGSKRGHGKNSYTQSIGLVDSLDSNL